MFAGVYQCKVDVSTSHLETIYGQGGGGCKGFWEMITWFSGGTER